MSSDVIIRPRDPMVHGFLLVNKPVGMTSNDAVAVVKKYLRCKRGVGHAGTLDPMAQGLLLIGVGRTATREFATMLYDKVYTATIEFGYETDSLDSEGVVVHRSDIVVSREQLIEALKYFCKTYQQVPPLYSALQYKGKRLYKLARSGTLSPEEQQSLIQQKARDVTVYDAELLSYEGTTAVIRVRVSHGTYIRSLIRDIAHHLGTYATLTELGRNAIGPFTLQQAFSLQELIESKDPCHYIGSKLLPVSRVLVT